MRFLKADTEQVVVMGPFVDATDGVTAETGISLDSSCEAYRYNSASAVDISGYTWAHIASGMYSLTIPAALVTVEGYLTIHIPIVATALHVWDQFQVVSANVYDSLFAASGTDTLDVQVSGLDADVITAAKIADNAIATEHIATGAISADSVASNTITAAKINADAITAAKIANDAIATEHIATGAITADSIGADTITAAKVADDVNIAIADATLERPISNVEGSLAYRTLAGAVSKLVNRVAIAGGTLTVYKTNDSTALGTQTVTTDADADNVTQLNTD